MDWLYPIVLSFHSILRWLVVIAAVLSIIRAINGLSFKRGWTQQDNRIGMWFTIFMDLQVLFGLLLYFVLSPLTTSALSNFGGVMGNASLRFFMVEHAFLMVIAMVVAHIGRSLIRKADTTMKKHRRTIIWYGASILLVLAAIPWPFLSNGRPLLRFFGL